MIPRLFATAIIATLGLHATTGVAAAQMLTGAATITDGDTIVVAGTKVRLNGIDAPETDQRCIDRDRRPYTCGLNSREALQRLIGDRPVECVGATSDVYGRRLMTCAAGGRDINAAMVAEGWALAFVRYSRDYVEEERRARERGAGLWAGAFIAPWDWRHRGSKTVILGSVSVPTDAQATLLQSLPVSTSPVSGCVIKGNINRRGERIYHLPGMRDYDRTIISERQGERWFCSESEAQTAGWRRAAR
ncbi:Succinoglycan biosynthesis protein ExoI [Afipia felis]|uniref:Succinoglycan biosynthesis protein ExoI n=1 Tax=Afipia felis TaxID=1035 RepID=A0A090MV08_AFIFE|nr:thermonuclease family protein [Afipia felis]CEG09699.1 Succinoglycan biosynthesis protein ExoI [Afipia felis]